MPAPSYTAFVITFERPQALRETIDALRAQTAPPSRILVVDNGRDRATEEIVAAYPPSVVEHHRLGSNTGPAGGAEFGLRTLAQSDGEWVLWVDDDDPPKWPDALERLLRLAAGGGFAMVGAFGARWDWRSGRLVRVPDRELRGAVEVDVVGGSGLPLIRRDVIERVGPPSAELFFGLEDWDFCLRLRSLGFSAAVDGELAYRYRETHGRLDRDPRRPLLPPYGYSSLWRRYYTTRNYIHLMRGKFGRPDLARRQAGRALFRALTGWGRGPRYGWRLTRLQIRGILDGYRSRLGRTVEPVGPRRPPAQDLPTVRAQGAEG